ncbi:hypothetical protein FIM12_06200 [SAR202 cluster bacterium AD-804-J14_MRT_500m]|nr:hypothetical protein [SAR202 cluster bacterium AD-804-J14_MRT_500m]
MGPTDRMTPFSITTVPLVMGSRPVQSMMLALVRTTVSCMFCDYKVVLEFIIESTRSHPQEF